VTEFRRQPNAPAPEMSGDHGGTGKHEDRSTKVTIGHNKEDEEKLEAPQSVSRLAEPKKSDSRLYP
jgi:hypothetical protein